MERFVTATRSTSTIVGNHYVDAAPRMASALVHLLSGSLDGKTRLVRCAFGWSSGDRIVREKNINLAIVMAIALVLASKRLQKHTGVAAADWRKELLEQALARLNSWSEQKIQKFMAENFGMLE